MKSKKSNLNIKAFTLVEVLVVVLIIGILAAIAVPKYQVAVAKSEYSTLKFKTRALAEAVNRHILATGTYPNEMQDLDISFSDLRSLTSPYIYFKNGQYCRVWKDGQDMVACYFKGTKMGFYFWFNTLKPLLCYTLKDYEAGNKVCQQETGRTKASRYCTGEDTFCTYYY